MAAVRGRTALITGAAHGIGKGTAKALAARGWSVALLDLDLEAAKAVASECGAGAVAFAADISDQEALDAAVAGTVEHFGGLDMCFANAGLATGGTLGQIDPDVFAVQVEINLTGTFRTVSACLPHLLDSRGYLLLNASGSALLAPPGLGSYGATKAGIESLGNTLRMELAHHGVDVGVLYLLWVATDMVEGGRAESEMFNILVGSMPGPLGKTMPLDKAVSLIVRGIEHRSERLYEPKLLKAMRFVRGLAPRRLEASVRAIAPEVEAASQRDMEKGRLEGGLRTGNAAGAAAARRVERRQG